MTRLIILFMLVTVSGPTLSAASWLDATVERTLVENDAFGLCMALIAPGPETVLPSCGSGWVTFSCSGDFNSKSAGNLKFQTAQLALLTDEEIGLWIDDARKHNGYCFAQRIDLR